MCRYFLEPDAVAVELCRQFVCAFDGAIGDNQLADTVFVQVARGEFDGLAGTDQQGRRVFEPAEDLPAEAHGGKGHRDRTCTDRRVGTDLFGDREGMLEQAVHQGIDPAGLQGCW